MTWKKGKEQFPIVGSAVTTRDNASSFQEGDSAERQISEMRDKSVRLLGLFEQESAHLQRKTFALEIAAFAVPLCLFVFAGEIVGNNPSIVVPEALCPGLTPDQCQLAVNDHPWSKIAMSATEIVTTIVVLVMVLPMVKDAKLSDKTKELLLAEHGNDEDKDATDEAKIEYQLERRLAGGARYWHTDSMETDFKFYVANRHPVLQFFAYEKPYGLSKFIRLLLECNAILVTVTLARSGAMEKVNVDFAYKHGSRHEYVILRVFWQAVVVTFPMFFAWLQRITLACPCQSSSASTGHFGSCALFCKFRMSSVLVGYWMLTALAMLKDHLFGSPWFIKLAALGARSLGYLLFFAQNYVTWVSWFCLPMPCFGKWKNEREKAKEIVSGQVKSPELRGESCQKAACKLCPVFTIACSPVIYSVLLLLGFLFLPLSAPRVVIALAVVAALANLWRYSVQKATRLEQQHSAEEHLLAGDLFS